MVLNRSVRSYNPENLKIYRTTPNGSELTVGTMRIEGNADGIPSLTPYPMHSNTELDAFGTTAIARIEPTNPAFDMSTFLGELRAEGLPNLPGSALRERTRLAKASGGEYLNLEFGWFPLIRGVRDFAQTVVDADDIIRQYQEGSGKTIQRRYQWPPEEQSRADACRFTMTPTVGFFTGGGQYQYVQRRKWFEAEFAYHVPTGQSINDKVRRYGSYGRKLLGLDLSPEVLWNLSPWSWAADWFGNVGDVMHNVSALGTDGLVMRHAYMMCHTQRVVQMGGSYGGRHQTKLIIEEEKNRRPGTPFGFGVAFSSLSRKQLAIVTALGLSRW